MAARPEGSWSSLVRLVLFLTVTITLTGFIAMQIARIDLSDSYRVVAVFDDVDGLVEGDMVKIGGAPVGQVSAIDVRRGRAEVTLSVRRQHRVPADSEAAIRWRNPIGQRVVYLIPGTAQARLAEDTRITRTRSVVDLGELINQLAPLTHTLDGEQINALLAAVRQALDGNEANIGQLIANVDALTSTVAARQQTLTRALADFSKVSEVLARRDEQIAAMTDDLVELTGAFVDNRKLVDRALVELSATLRTSDRIVSGSAAELEPVVDGLATVMGGTRRNLNRLEPVLKTAGPKMGRLFPILNKGGYFVGAVPCITLAPGQCPYGSEVKPYAAALGGPTLIPGGD